MSVHGYGDHLADGTIGTSDPSAVPLDLRYPIWLSISGLMGSGKTWAASDLADQLREKWNRTVWVTSFGDLCREEWCRRRGIPEAPHPISTEELQDLGITLSGPDGYGLTDRLMAKILDHRGEDIIVDGGRRLMELLFLRNVGFKMVWMETPADLRLDRLLGRRRDASFVDVGQVMRMMRHPLELEAAEAARHPDLWHAVWPNMWRPVP